MLTYLQRSTAEIDTHARRLMIVGDYIGRSRIKLIDRSFDECEAIGVISDGDSLPRLYIKLRGERRPRTFKVGPSGDVATIVTELSNATGAPKGEIICHEEGAY